MSTKYELDMLEDAHIAVSNLAAKVHSEHPNQFSDLYHFLEYTSMLIDLYRDAINRK